jgi:hypothetical protein
MKRKRQKKGNFLQKFQIEKNILLDVFIASLIVQQAPKLLNQYLFKTKPLTGDMLELAGAGTAIGVGFLMKKPTISNAGIALAVGDIANTEIGSKLLPSPAQPAGGAAQNLQDYSMQPRLNDYTNNVGIQPAAVYANAY